MDLTLLKRSRLYEIPGGHHHRTSRRVTKKMPYHSLRTGQGGDRRTGANPRWRSRASIPLGLYVRISRLGGIVSSRPPEKLTGTPPKTTGLSA